MMQRERVLVLVLVLVLVPVLVLVSVSVLVLAVARRRFWQGTGRSLSRARGRCRGASGARASSRLAAQLRSIYRFRRKLFTEFSQILVVIDLQFLFVLLIYHILCLLSNGASSRRAAQLSWNCSNFMNLPFCELSELNLYNCSCY